MNTIAALLGCGNNDVEVIERIDEDILEEAMQTLRNEGLALNFGSVYEACAKVGLKRAGVPERGVEVDNNYACAAIYVPDDIQARIYKKKLEHLEQMGFRVYY